MNKIMKIVSKIDKKKVRKEDWSKVIYLIEIYNHPACFKSVFFANEERMQRKGTEEIFLFCHSNITFMKKKKEKKKKFLFESKDLRYVLHRHTHKHHAIKLIIPPNLFFLCVYACFFVVAGVFISFYTWNFLLHTYMRHSLLLLLLLLVRIQFFWHW